MKLKLALPLSLLLCLSAVSLWMLVDAPASRVDSVAEDVFAGQRSPGLQSDRPADRAIGRRVVPAVASDGGLQVDPIDDLGQAKPDDPKAALYPFMGLANFYPPDDEITEEELPAIIHRVAKLGPGFFEHRYEVNLYRKRAAKLPPEEAQLASSLFEQYEHLIQSYETEADSAFSEAQDDFLLGAKFLVHDRAQGMPAPRPDGESHLATNCMLGMGPFVVDIGFRSADYPELNHLLGVMNAQRERLRTDLNVLLELQGLPQIGKHDARAR